ncbi:MAG: DoxX family protein [Gammaproteobacteria bacterium]|jgi:putative oxidoreductase
MKEKSTFVINKLNAWASIVPESIVALVIRFAIASVFWRSAQTKIDDWTMFGQNWKFWNVTDSTIFLFQYEYSLSFLPVKFAAYSATFGEFFLSLAIIVGLFTRFSAIGLIAMTLVIQFFVYPESWSVHILWAGLLLYLVKHGAGTVSLDHLIHKKFIG